MKKGKDRRRFNGAFVVLGKGMLFQCREWHALSLGARSLYILVKSKFTGSNNGGLCVSYSEATRYGGLKSSQTVSRCFKELEVKGWIKATERGGLFRRPTKYQLTGTFDKHF
jgi:hypothetical protein